MTDSVHAEADASSSNCSTWVARPTPRACPGGGDCRLHLPPLPRRASSALRMGPAFSGSPRRGGDGRGAGVRRGVRPCGSPVAAPGSTASRSTDQRLPVNGPVPPGRGEPAYRLVRRVDRNRALPARGGRCRDDCDRGRSGRCTSVASFDERRHERLAARGHISQLRRGATRATGRCYLHLIEPVGTPEAAVSAPRCAAPGPLRIVRRDGPAFCSGGAGRGPGGPRGFRDRLHRESGSGRPPAALDAAWNAPDASTFYERRTRISYPFLPRSLHS